MAFSIDGKPLARNRQKRRDHVTVLHVGRGDGEIDQMLERVGDRVAFFAFNFLTCVISDRIDLRRNTP
jgi:hypothetical protein